MTTVVDASALLAFLRGEPGADRVAEVLARPAAISAVNYAEVLAKLADGRASADELARRFEEDGLVGGVLGVEAVLAEDAAPIAALRHSSSRAGLSLGDRACLALALRLGRPVVTADRAWQELELEVDVLPIR